MATIQKEIRDELCILRLDHGKPNSISQAVSEELMADARASHDRIVRVLERSEGTTDPDPATMDRFVARMDDDFSTPEALSVLFDAVRDANRALDAGEEAGPMVAAVHEIVDVLGLRPVEAGLDDMHPALLELAVEVGAAAEGTAETVLAALLDRRANARSERDFATSDAIRDGLKALGIVVEDTADGARWHRA